jgi:hypothetical protein
MRLPLLASSDVSPEQRPLYDDMRKGIETNLRGFTAIDQTGALIGPWNPWLHFPKLKQGARLMPIRNRLTVSKVTPAYWRVVIDNLLINLLAAPHPPVQIFVAASSPASQPSKKRCLDHHMSLDMWYACRNIKARPRHWRIVPLAAATAPGDARTIRP